MRVRNIECQLAQGQVRRYLNGDPLSDVAVEQLEDHLGECPDCNEFFQDCKQELIEDKAESEIEEEVYAPAQSSASSEISAVPRFLVDAIRQKRETLDKVVKPIATHAVINDVREERQSFKSYTKPLAYSIVLAGVLIAMSTFMRDPSRVLGDRVETALPAAKAAIVGPTTLASSEGSSSTVPKSDQSELVTTIPETNSTTPTSEQPKTGTNNLESKSVTTDSTSNEAQKMKTANPPDTTSGKPATANSTSGNTASVVAPSPRRRTTNRRSAPTRPVARRQRPVAKPVVKAPASKPGIRVYDDNGNPISNR